MAHSRSSAALALLVLLAGAQAAQAGRALQQGRTQATLPDDTQYFPSSCSSRCKFEDDFHQPLPTMPSPNTGDRVSQWASIMLLGVSFFCCCFQCRAFLGPVTTERLSGESHLLGATPR